MSANSGAGGRGGSRLPDATLTGAGRAADAHLRLTLPDCAHLHLALSLEELGDEDLLECVTTQALGSQAPSTYPSSETCHPSRRIVSMKCFRGPGFGCQARAESALEALPPAAPSRRDSGQNFLKDSCCNQDPFGTSLSLLLLLNRLLQEFDRAALCPDAASPLTSTILLSAHSSPHNAIIPIKRSICSRALKGPTGWPPLSSM